MCVRKLLMSPQVYDLTNFTPFPADLASCASLFAEKVTGYPHKYKAEAAIVNYYPVGTTLSGEHMKRLFRIEVIVRYR